MPSAYYTDSTQRNEQVRKVLMSSSYSCSIVARVRGGQLPAISTPLDSLSFGILLSLCLIFMRKLSFWVVLYGGCTRKKVTRNAYTNICKSLLPLAHTHTAPLASPVHRAWVQKMKSKFAVKTRAVRLWPPSMLPFVEDNGAFVNF